MNGYSIVALLSIMHTINIIVVLSQLTDIVLEEVRAVPRCNVLWVGYDNELAVAEATQAVGLQVLLGPKDTPGTLNDLFEVGKGWLDILCGIEAQSLQEECRTQILTTSIQSCLNRLKIVQFLKGDDPIYFDKKEDMHGLPPRMLEIEGLDVCIILTVSSCFFLARARETAMFMSNISSASRSRRT